MRILLAHPGSSVSTHDVFVGLRAGLVAAGCEVYDYALDGRIERSGQWLHNCYRRAKRECEKNGVAFTLEKPNPSDVMYHAGSDLVTRALRVEPDVVLVVSAMFMHPDVFVLMRRAGLRVAVLFTESPYDDERQARLLPWVDVAWTNERSSAREMSIRYLPHAWSPDVHQPLNIDVPAHDVVFVGTGFQERIDLLHAVDWTGIDVGLYGTWELMGSRNSLRDHIKGGFRDNAVTAQLYRKAKIGLNLYRTSKGFGRDVPKITAAESLNPRAYELAAMGCFTISSPRAEVAERFGDHVPTYVDAADLSACLRRWLADDDGRAQHAARLPACVAEDTWHHRARQVIADLRDAGIVARPPSAPVWAAEAV